MNCKLEKVICGFCTQFSLVEREREREGVGVRSVSLAVLYLEGKASGLREGSVSSTLFPFFFFPS